MLAATGRRVPRAAFSGLPCVGALDASERGECGAAPRALPRLSHAWKSKWTFDLVDLKGKFDKIFQKQSFIRRMSKSSALDANGAPESCAARCRGQGSWSQPLKRRNHMRGIKLKFKVNLDAFAMALPSRCSRVKWAEAIHWLGGLESRAG